MKSILLAAMVLAGCQPPPSPHPAPSFDASAAIDAGPVDPACARGCAALRAIGCSEGAPACEGVCTRDQRAGYAEHRPDCLADAGTKEAARACGTVDCP